MKPTSIEWTDYSSNPIRAWGPETEKRGWACTRISAGCDHCYAATLNQRWGTREDFTKAGNAAVRWYLDERELRAILREKATGLKVFVADMTDLFHVRVREEWLARLFAVFALRPDLTFQLLTKRPAIARQYLNDPRSPGRAAAHLPDFWEVAGRPDLSDARWRLDQWPLDNVWLGTSVEDARVAGRVEFLRQCQARVRFISAEPLLGPPGITDWSGIHWLIAGGESNGPVERRLVRRTQIISGTNPLQPTPEALGWVRELRDQCAANGVAFFFKQWGGPSPKSGGRLLDGRTWDEYPAVAELVPS